MPARAKPIEVKRASRRAREARYRAERRPSYVAKQQRGYKKKRDGLQALVNELKSKPCSDCGGTFDPICMDFDHRPNEKKVGSIASIVASRNEPRLRAEIAKCDLVCANCHRLRTKRRREQRITTARLTNPQLELPTPP